MALPSFFASAACRDVDTWFFFPWSANSRPSPLAVKACSNCGVREECLTYSLRHPMPDGYWGGMTLPERVAERKRRHIQKQTDSRRAARKAAAGQQEEAA